MDGGAGADRLRGGSDNDIIRDGSGGDRIEGRAGSDKIFLSSDSITDDIRFRLDDSGAPESGVDTILRFDTSSPGADRGQPGGDRLDLAEYGFQERGQILLESTKLGTELSVDPTGEDPDDAVELAVLVGISPDDLTAEDGLINTDIILL